MTRTLLKAQRDTGQLVVLSHEPYPVLNCRIDVMLQYGRHALRRNRPTGSRVDEFSRNSCSLQITQGP
jgi:hypothetical protein